MTETTQGLGSVQKAPLLPLWGRAVESRKERPLLVDRAALEIVGKLDYDFSTIAAGIHLSRASPGSRAPSTSSGR